MAFGRRASLPNVHLGVQAIVSSTHCRTLEQPPSVRRGAVSRPATRPLATEPTTMAFRFDQLTLKSQEAVQKAQSLARERGHQRLEPMHLLAALLDPDQQVIRSLLTQLGVNPAQVLKAAEEGLELRCPRSAAASRRSAPT